MISCKSILPFWITILPFWYVTAWELRAIHIIVKYPAQISSYFLSFPFTPLSWEKPNLLAWVTLRLARPLAILYVERSISRRLIGAGHALCISVNSTRAAGEARAAPRAAAWRTARGGSFVEEEALRARDGSTHAIVCGRTTLQKRPAVAG